LRRQRHGRWRRWRRWRRRWWRWITTDKGRFLHKTSV